MGNTGAASAVKGIDLAAKAASPAKSQGNRRVDDGFQKLLNSKAEEDTGAGKADDSPKAEAKTDDTKELQEDQAPKEEKEEAKVQEESIVPAENTLDQVQAAMLFRIEPEAYTEAEMPAAAAVAAEEPEAAPELIQTVTAELVSEQPEAAVSAVSEENAVPAAFAETVSEEAPAETVQKFAEQVTVEVSAHTQEARQTGKEPAKQGTESLHEAAGQQVQAVQPREYRTEEASAHTEVPVQTVRVQEPEEIPDKVLEQLLVKTVDGRKEFEIQLEPEELGKILIRVAVAKEATTVSIICTEQRTMELMAKNARDIGAIMEERLETPTTIVVEEKEPSYLEQKNQQNSGNAEQEQGQQKQNEKSREKEGSDFLQQLRLGLV